MKNVHKNIINGSVIAIAFIIFLIRLGFCAKTKMWAIVHGSDFNGYIELANNIFSRADFTVRWELDSPLFYPPFFSILIRVVSSWTNDPVTAIQYISVFSSSFCIIPLYFLVKSILNVYSGVMAAIFTVYFFGISPCTQLTSDYFFCFLIITSCWLLWNALNSSQYKEVKFIAVGILVGITYLTKFSGILLCALGAGSIFYYYSKQNGDIQKSLKMILLFILGFLPLFFTYQLIIHASPYQEDHSISAFTFFDGNYVYEGGNKYRDKKCYQLNAQGTEYDYISFLRTHTIWKFCLERPGFVVQKYFWDLGKQINYITENFFPFTPENLNYTPFPLYLFFLVPLGVFFFLGRDVDIAHVLLFTAIMPLAAFFHFTERYVMPFIPLYFVLWIYVFDSWYVLTVALVDNRYKIFLRGFVVLVFVLFAGMYITEGCKKFIWPDTDFMDEIGIINGIKADAAHLSHPTRVMSSHGLAYLTNSRFIRFPSSYDWEKIVQFAAMRNVDYIVIKKEEFKRMEKESRVAAQSLARPIPLNRRRFLVFRISH